jgi:hypothetical protein
MTRGNLRKPLFWTNIIVLVVFGLTMADVIFGWTNPSSGPPTPPGVLRATSGEVGIGVDPVGGNTLSISGQVNLTGSGQIVNTLWPTASSSVATKGYVDAAGGGSDANSGGITTVTIFGTAATQVTGTNLFRGPNSAVPSGCHSALPGVCNLLLSALWGSGVQNYSVQPVAGEGTPACTSLATPPAESGTWQWFEIFAGYGPHETVVNNYAITGLQPIADPVPPDPNASSSFTWQVGEDLVSGYGDIKNSDVVITGVSVSDSVCSQAVEQNVSVVNAINGDQIGSSAGRNSACTPYECNTCRICGLVRTISP